MTKRIIYLGADSAGFSLKEEIKVHLSDAGYEVHDMGTDSDASCHYPIFAAAVCESVQKNPDGAFGVLICGTGIGMSMCANKHKGIRAALCSDTFSAKMTRAHNDANVMVMPGRFIETASAKECVETFLNTPFEGGRHQARIDAIPVK